MKQITVAFSVLFAAIAACQAPTPGPEMKKLSMFDGEWVGKAKNYLEPGAPPQVTDAKMSIGLVMGGMYHRMTYESDMPGMGKIDGLILTGWDAAKKAYKSFNFNNFIPMPVLESSVFDGEAMVGKSEPMDMGMGPMVQHSRMWLKSKDELFIKIEAEVGGQRMVMLELELKRK